MNRRTGNAEEEFQLAQRAYTIIDSLATKHDESDYVDALANQCKALGDRLTRRGDYERATRYFTAGYETAAQLVEQHPDKLQYRKNVAICAQALGQVHAIEGKSSDSQRSFEEAVQYYSQLADSVPEETRYSRELADALRDLSLLLASQGDLLGAEQNLRRAAKLVEDVAKATPAATNSLGALRSVYQALAHVQLAAGRTDDARRSLTTCLDAVTDQARLSPNDDLTQLGLAAELADTPIEDLRDPARASQVLSSVRDLARFESNPMISYRLGIIWLRLGNATEALSWLNRAQPAGYFETPFYQALAHLDLGNHGKAKEHFESGLLGLQKAPRKFLAFRLRDEVASRLDLGDSDLTR